jgi:RNA recognition motif-containing protein
MTNRNTRGRGADRASQIFEQLHSESLIPSGIVMVKRHNLKHSSFIRDLFRFQKSIAHNARETSPLPKNKILEQIHRHLSTSSEHLSLPTATSILISNIPTEITSNELHRHLSRMGEIKEIIRKQSGIVKVVYVRRSSAIEAVQRLHQILFHGAILHVHLQGNTKKALQPPSSRTTFT